MDRSTRIRRSRYTLAAALVASVGVHAVVLLMPLMPRASSGAVRVGAEAPRLQASALRLIDLAVADDAAAPTPAPPTAVEPSQPSPLVPTPAPPDAQPEQLLPAATEGPPASGEPRLGVPLLDARLWQAPPTPTAHAFERMMDRAFLTQGVRAYHDSVAVAAGELPPGMSTWAGGGEDETRWGVSPGTLHLGSIPIPTCGGSGATTAADCGFGMTPERRIEFREWMFTYNEIQRQSHAVQLQMIRDERAAAMRAAADAVRRGPGGNR